jgi:hypothetical protein
MRFYTRSHQYYCGVDLHTRKMYVCVVDASGEVVLHRNLTASPKAFLDAVAPFRDGLSRTPSSPEPRQPRQYRRGLILARVCRRSST